MDSAKAAPDILHPPPLHETSFPPPPTPPLPPPPPPHGGVPSTPSNMSNSATPPAGLTMSPTSEFSTPYPSQNKENVKRNDDVPIAASVVNPVVNTVVKMVVNPPDFSPVVRSEFTEPPPRTYEETIALTAPPTPPPTPPPPTPPPVRHPPTPSTSQTDAETGSGISDGIERNSGAERVLSPTSSEAAIRVVCGVNGGPQSSPKISKSDQTKDNLSKNNFHTGRTPVVDDDDRSTATKTTMATTLTLTSTTTKSKSKRNGENSKDENENRSSESPPAAIKFGFKRRRRRRLVLLGAILIVFGVIVLFGFVTWSNVSCWEPNCRLAGRISSFMNLSVDPCQDFYQYSCGNWVATAQLPPSANIYGSGLYFLRRRVEERVEALLAMEVDPASPIDGAERKLKTLARMCADDDERRERVKGAARRLVGKMTDAADLAVPLSIGKEEKHVDAQRRRELITKYRKYLAFVAAPFFSVELSPAFDSDEDYVVVFDQSGLTLKSPSFYSGRSDYESRMRDQIRLLAFYFDYSKDDAEVFQESVWNLEAELATFYKADGDESRSDITKLFNKRTVAQLQAILPSVDVLNVISAYGVHNLTTESEVVVTSDEYFRRLNRLLEENRIEDIRNYMSWKLMWHLNHLIPGLLGDEEGRRTSCIKQLTHNYMPKAVSSIYVREDFTSADKEVLLEMFEDTKSALKSSIRRNDWMSPSTKEEALAKAEAMIEKMGYPDYLDAEGFVDDSYSGLKVDAETFLENFVDWIPEMARAYGMQADEARTRQMWSTENVANVNAFYDPTKNSIEFPAGILAAPLYDREAPMYVNFGAIGMVIGHEMTHGFDRLGKSFDSHGVLRNWWSAESESAYSARSRCFLDHFAKQTVDAGDGRRLPVNARISLDENMSDDAGLRLAKDAYDIWRRRRRNGVPEEPLRLIDAHGEALATPLDVDQLFYVAFAQAWCDAFDPNYIRYYLDTDRHLPGEARVRGTVALQKGFREAMNCQKGDAMVAERSCKIW